MKTVQKNKIVILLFVLWVGLCPLGCKDRGPEPVVSSESESFRWPEPENKNNPTESLIFETNLSEDMILDLSPGLKLMARHFRGQDVVLSDLLADSFSYLGPEEFNLAASLEKFAASGKVTHIDWPIQKKLKPAAHDQVWEPILSQAQFSDTQFGVIEGTVDRAANVFRMKTIFEGRFQDNAQRRFGVQAKQVLEWVSVGGDQWKISSWKQGDIHVTFSSFSIFEDVTAKVIPDQPVSDFLAKSRHEEIMQAKFKSKERDPKANPLFPFFSDWESSYQYPASSVVDFDGDGWDDLFVMDRSGKSVLLRNQQGRSFQDVTEESGLHVGAFANMALFADFDNDGDPDVLVGRTLGASLFFRNEGGKFVSDEQTNKNLAYAKFVVAGSVADINRDGLLDVYLNTYCFTGYSPEDWVPKVVRPEDELKLRLMIDQNNPFLDRPGPPNFVLMNRGGVLELAQIDDTLKQWRSSYQSVWHDIDQDGDPDLYVCNDFSPDVFLRNDTSPDSAEPKFTDVTKEVFPDGNMAFGMGASFGDYDSDGKLDLYVSNMYSKAGLRIVKKLGGDVDPKIKASAQGNFLYRNLGGAFEQVAGLKSPAQRVSKVGWSFGGQLADLNNDTKLDLYVPSGFFTAPKLLESSVDL